MKKKNLFLIALLCAYSTMASAWHVVFSENNTVATIYSDANNMPDSNIKDNFSGITYPVGVTNGGDLLKAATTLKFVATDEFPISTLDAFQGGKPYAATTVDYSEATFSPLASFGPVIYYKYAPNAQGQKYSYDLSEKQYVADTNGKYIQVTETYHTNCMTFAYFENLTKAVMSPTVDMLCQNCFQNNPDYHNEFEDESDAATYLIPSSVKYIATGAFDNVPINSITIPATVDYIDTGAFRNGVINHIIDVYAKGNTAAASNAFDKQNTVDQTVAQGKFTNLHYSPDLADMFVNANHELDLPTSVHAGDFQAWLNDHHNFAANGWQEFVSSSSGDPIPIPEGQTVVLRTFSDYVAHYVPTNFRAFLVNGVKSDGNGGYILLLQETFAIPANTGVIIYGEVRDRKSGFGLPILSGASWQTNPYNRKARQTEVDNKKINLQNFLVPSTTSDHQTTNIAGPYDADANNEYVLERNFIMAKYTNTTLNITNPLTTAMMKKYTVCASHLRSHIPQ